MSLDISKIKDRDTANALDAALNTGTATLGTISGGSITGTSLISTGTLAVTGQTTLGAGVAGAASLVFPTGVLKTTPAAGTLEYDGVVHYETPIASERGVMSGVQFITMQGGTYTLTSQTAAQQLFNSPAGGQVTVGGSRSYEFTCYFDLSSMSASSGAFGFALGGTATFTYLSWVSAANKAVLATAASSQQTVNKNSAANTAICTATTGTVGWALINGLLRVNAGGTIIPQVSLGVAAAAVVGQDSYFMLWPLGTSTVTSVGNWS